MFAHNATADVATADVSKQAGNGLRRGTHGKPFPCTVCGLRGQKLLEQNGREGVLQQPPLLSLTPPPEKVK
jgi:hypothetical protein